MQISQNELWVARDGLQTAQNELWVVREELQAVKDELRNKAMLLNSARCEASEAESSIERLTDVCHAFLALILNEYPISIFLLYP